MLVTEKQAREKWCPFTVGRPANLAKPEHARCIASSCMAWRPVVSVTEDLDDKFMGYCGLAGKPA